MYIILGWLLGLLGPRIIDLIQRPYRRAELRRSLLTELEDLKVKLALVACALADRGGMIDRAFLEWLEPIVRTHKGEFSDLPIADTIKGLLGRTDDELRAISQISQRAGRAPGLKKYKLPFLTSQITSLSLFSPEFQRRILQVNARLGMLNDEIDMAWFNYTKTFDSSLSEDNRMIILGNLEQSYQTIMRMCRDIVCSISFIESHQDQ